MATSVAFSSAANFSTARARSEPLAIAAAPAADPSSARSTKTASVTVISETAKVAGLAASGPKSFGAVATDARGTLDAAYAKLGRTVDNTTSATDWETSFEGMDRRSLYAVKSNQGGQFSEMEQKAAGYVMAKLGSRAMGLDTPAGQLGLIDHKESYKNAVKFLDDASPEEKASFEWAQSRASSQWAYEALSRKEGEEPENLESGNALVKMVKSAFDALEKLGDPSKQLSDMKEYQDAEKFFERQKAGVANLVDIRA